MVDNQVLADAAALKPEASDSSNKTQSLKKKKRRKKSKPLASTAVAAATTTTVISHSETNNENPQNSTSTIVSTDSKPKRKRNKKKPKPSNTNDNSPRNENKTENLISKTFQSSRRNSDNQISNQKQKLEEDLSLASLNGNTNNAPGVKTKSINAPKVTTDSNKISTPVIKKSNCDNSVIEPVCALNGKIKNEQTNTVTMNRVKVVNDSENASAGKIAANQGGEKSREEILTQRKAKKLAKQTKTKDKSSEIKTTDGNQVKSCTDTRNQLPNEGQSLSSLKGDSVESKVVVNQVTPRKQMDDLINKIESIRIVEKPATKTSSSTSDSSKVVVEKSREQILAEREAKKLAKQAAKNKNKNSSEVVTQKSTTTVTSTTTTKQSSLVSEAPSSTNTEEINQSSASVIVDQNEVKKPTTKAERRAIQEAQRQAKAKLLAEKQQQQKRDITKQQEKNETKTVAVSKEKLSQQSSRPKTTIKTENRVKLFNHLYGALKEQNLFVNNTSIHPVMVRLGEQYSKRTVVGANARCIAFLNALKTVIREFETPPKKEFSRVLETHIKNCIDYLHKCRPLAVSVINAHKYIKILLTQLKSDQAESDLKEHLLQCIDDYIKDQIEKAAQAINSAVQEKISDGDVILTYGCSSLINHILEEALNRHVSFRVICVDSRPFREGQEMLRRLVSKGIPCTCVLINAVGFIMPDVTKVLLGAHAILANGYVMSRTGTAQVALVAKSYNVPVLVCCETHKFSERVQTDAIVYNELGNPDNVIEISSFSKSSPTTTNSIKNWRVIDKLSPLNLNYDITPSELVTAVVTEVAILPCTSVPVILRIKPSETGY